jgi:hypothetical protein
MNAVLADFPAASAPTTNQRKHDESTRFLCQELIQQQRDSSELSDAELIWVYYHHFKMKW